MSLFHARMKKIKSKMKALYSVHNISPIVSLIYGDFFSDAQGQLTLQSMVGSGRISNLSEILWLSSLPARMKKIQSNIKALKCSQHYTLNFQTLNGR